MVATKPLWLCTHRVGHIPRLSIRFAAGELVPIRIFVQLGRSSWQTRPERLAWHVN